MSDTTLIAENTPSTGTAQPAVAPATTPAPAAAAPASTTAPEQQPTEAKPADAPTDKPVDKPAEGTEAKAAEKPTVPEKYEFKAPEGSELNPVVMAKFEGVAKDLGLSQEAAQKVLDAMGPEIVSAQKAQVEAIKTQWAESAKTDKEFGGDKLNENLAVAKKALDAFGSPELRMLLNDTGLGNHPEIIRAFFKAGQKISSGSFIPSGGGAVSAKDAASALYPNQK